MNLMENRVLVLGMNGSGRVEVQLHVNLNSALRWRRLVSLTPTPRYKWRKCTRYALNGILVGPQSQSEKASKSRAIGATVFKNRAVKMLDYPRHLLWCRPFINTWGVQVLRYPIFFLGEWKQIET